MGPAIKAEVRKLLTTRMWWGMAIMLFAIGALLALFIGLLSDTDPSSEAIEAGAPVFTPTELATNVYTAGSAFGYVILMVIGIMTIGSEYRHKTLTGSLLAVPRRARLIFAKIIALLGFGVMYGVIFLIGSVSIGATVLSMRGFDVLPDAGAICRSLGLLLLVLGLWALIGLGLGILIPNQVAAILVGVGGAFIVEPLLTFLASQTEIGETIQKFFPGPATQAVLGGYAGDTAQLSWWAGALVLAAYAAVFTGLGTLLTQRRDVS
ncbi:ABC transporter permease [Demetria terragena]|uniref:ABC transporter permease n=1 Tax=Demetria terragena TaxID=63959 RepID=UPI0003687A01|nr:ABC transporter permease [Demetria terragena]